MFVHACMQVPVKNGYIYPNVIRERIFTIIVEDLARMILKDILKALGKSKHKIMSGTCLYMLACKFP